MDIQNLVLRPNCLLTKSSLVFVPGPRSLFFYQRPFGLLPTFLYEHGYRIALAPLPFRGLSRRRQAFKKWLNLKAEYRFHFFMSPVTYQELKDLIEPEKMESLTFLDKDSSDTPAILPSVKFRTPLSYRLHQLISHLYGESVPTYDSTYSKFNAINYDRILDHCIKLAENEIYA